MNEEIDLSKPFELTVKGELMDKNGKKYSAGIFAPGEGLPDELRKSHYGRNVEEKAEVKAAPTTPKPPVSNVVQLEPVTTPSL